MLKKEFINPLKAYKIKYMGRGAIINIFPLLLANCCRQSYIINIKGSTQPLCYDWTKLMEFKNNLSIVIANENYDLLDNIILEFFKTYNYKILTKQSSYLLFKIEFPKDAEDNFIETCNNFKDKQWDDILDDFLEALYIFLNTGTVHGQKTF